MKLQERQIMKLGKILMIRSMGEDLHGQRKNHIVTTHSQQYYH